MEHGAFQTVVALPAETLGRSITVDLTATHTKAELMKAVRRALKLPATFGNNWDALADVLTDLDIDTVVFADASGLDDETAETLGEILTDMAESEFGPARAIVQRTRPVPTLIQRRPRK